MGKNDARAQVSEPKVTPAAVRMPDDLTPEQEDFIHLRDKEAARVAAASRHAAEHALTAGGSMARAYALAAAEHLQQADWNPNARASARRLLRLALAHLET